MEPRDTHEVGRGERKRRKNRKIKKEQEGGQENEKPCTGEHTAEFDTFWHAKPRSHAVVWYTTAVLKQDVLDSRQQLTLFVREEPRGLRVDIQDQLIDGFLDDRQRRHRAIRYRRNRRVDIQRRLGRDNGVLVPIVVYRAGLLVLGGRTVVGRAVRMMIGRIVWLVMLVRGRILVREVMVVVHLQLCRRGRVCMVLLLLVMECLE
jgi:hypothetical protein